MSSEKCHKFKLKSLKEVTTFISRGITPLYSEDGVKVINQKCIKNHELTPVDVKKTDSVKKKIHPNKYLKKYDVLINSTGVGTLGRTAQIKNIKEDLTVDSHVTIVRPDKNIDPCYLGYAIQMNENNIEKLAEGSTGQTELSRLRLSDEILLSYPNIVIQQQISFILNTLNMALQINKMINKKLFLFILTILLFLITILLLAASIYIP